MAFEGKEFEAYVPISKATESADGKWLVSGPIASLDEDYDGDILEKAGIIKGLDMFKRLGSHVDWDHQYNKTKNVEYLIGKGIEIGEVDGVPWLTTELFKSKKKAQDLWQHLQDGGTAGYSLLGKAVKVVGEKPRRILETQIHMMTIAPSPKGFGQTNVVIGPLNQLAKSLVSECIGDEEEVEETAEDTVEEEVLEEKSIEHGKCLTKQEAHYRPKASTWRCANCFYFDVDHCHRVEGTVEPEAVCDYFEEKTEKAMTAGEGVVMPGETGGAALRKQDLKKGPVHVIGGKVVITVHKRCKKCKKHPCVCDKEVSKSLVNILRNKGVASPEKIAKAIQGGPNGGRKD